MTVQELLRYDGGHSSHDGQSLKYIPHIAPKREGLRPETFVKPFF